MKRERRRYERNLTTDGFGALFRHFRRILNLNNQILEMIADLERALGGDYIFDRAFMNVSVNNIIERGRQVIYHLNAMGAERYSLLYDRFTDTGDHLIDILAGGPGPYGPQLVLDGGVLHRDLIHLAGGKGSNLGEVKNGLKLPSPPLFVVSVTGYNRFMAANNLFVSINSVLGETPDAAIRAEKISKLFKSAKLPSDLKRAIDEALKNLKKQTGKQARFAVRSSGVGEDGERSFAGQFESFLDVPSGEVAAACLNVMACRFSERLLTYLGPEAPAEEIPMAVVVQPMLPGQASGVLYTRDPANPGAEAMVVSAVAGLGESLVSGLDSGDRFTLSRSHPFDLRASTLTTHDHQSMPGAEGFTASGLRRGSGVIDLATLRLLAEYGLLLEKRFESPQDIEWCVDTEGTLWILQSRPLRLRMGDQSRTPADIGAELATLPVLMANHGHVCQLGLAGGRVVQVTEETTPESFPVGGVAVSRYASPRLAGIVRRAAAIITDIGSPTGHLATITREYRTPALFGTEVATKLLADNTEVIVDVEERTVYGGHIELPADLPQGGGFEPMADNPEARLLRRLLRLIAPLNLVDPGDSSFRMENCRTVHDFLRFCHEKAVGELIDFHTSGRAVSGGAAPLLDAPIPIRIRLIDVGGGIDQINDNLVSREHITSRPFQSLMQGLLREEAWDRESAAFGVKDFLSGLSRPLSMLTHGPAYSGENLAIIAENYCNLSLRLGYHFNIIDCYLSDEPDDNYIYFRFVGGFAVEGKRVRRATLIAQILAGLHFKVEVKGDLVLGKAKMLERTHLENILVHLGELVAFTRQLDVKMTDEAAVDRFFTDFLTRIRTVQKG